MSLIGLGRVGAGVGGAPSTMTVKKETNKPRPVILGPLGLSVVETREIPDVFVETKMIILWQKKIFSEPSPRTFCGQTSPDLQCLVFLFTWRAINLSTLFWCQNALEKPAVQIYIPACSFAQLYVKA